jgi:hypothetical protein
VQDPGGVRDGPPPFTGHRSGPPSVFDVAPAPPVPAPPAFTPPAPPVTCPPVPVPPDPLAPPLEALPGGQPPSARKGPPFGHVFEKTSSDSELHDSIAEATQMLRKRVEIADIGPAWDAPRERRL